MCASCDNLDPSFSALRTVCAIKNCFFFFWPGTYGTFVGTGWSQRTRNKNVAFFFFLGREELPPFYLWYTLHWELFVPVLFHLSFGQLGGKGPQLCLHLLLLLLLLLKGGPNQQRWHAKWELSRNTYTLRARFLRVLVPICMRSR